MTRHKYLNEWRLWMPLISGYALSTLCPIRSYESKKLPQRPPAYVFGIVWPILYILLGTSWTHTRTDKESDFKHGLLTLFLCLWIVTFSCFKNKKFGMYILSCVFAIVICCMCLHKKRWAKIALTPLLAWTSLAMHLNYHIIDE